MLQTPRITVFDATGKVIYQRSEQGLLTRISVTTAGFELGLYILLVEDESGVMRRAMFSVL
jgi:hypothetical protein